MSSLLTTTPTPPPEVPGATAVAVPGGGGRLPRPVRFVGRALATLWSNGKARIGLCILAFMILVAIFAPLIAPHSPQATDFPPYQGPSGRNWFGTTGNGQDVFSQMVYGARISLLVGLVSGASATLLAITLGLIISCRRPAALIKYRPIAVPNHDFRLTGWRGKVLRMAPGIIVILAEATVTSDDLIESIEYSETINRHGLRSLFLRSPPTKQMPFFFCCVAWRSIKYLLSN